MLYYNKLTSELSSTPPWGNSWISDELKQQYYNQGWEQVSDDFVPPLQSKTNDELLNEIRAKRDQLFNETQWIFMRQMTGTTEQKLSDIEYQKWINYWIVLRDFPESCNPHLPEWPEVPQI